MADQVLTVNGERSKYHGAAGTAMVAFVPISNRESDFFYRSYFDEDALAEAYRGTSEDSRELLRGYIAGYNEFIDLTPGAGSSTRSLRPPLRRRLRRRLSRQERWDPQRESDGGSNAKNRLPALDRDVVLAQLNPYFMRGAASNAYAVGKDATGNRAGMLLGNPHWPGSGPASSSRST